ncbi:aromatic amino acid exporter YddG [Ochrobactrum sp. BTU1]|uniref:aromatic amino acid exporter YddG n=1 Tax=Ochrobactrum sp. BTU1 TaxID=2840456 RepID=UPI00207B69B9
MEKGSGKATTIGLIAIGLWASLALFTVEAKGIPPFELLALSFGVAFLSGMIVLASQGFHALRRLRQPVAPWFLAFFAIFLYHALYFYSLSTVPPARASLIAYLWPLLIVILSTFGPNGDRLRWQHLAGGALGFIGTAVILLDHQGERSQATSVLGYIAAFGCALIWSAYSVANRRFANISSDMLVGVCGMVAIAGAGVHFLLEETVWPTQPQWQAVLLLGVGPVGHAFLAWDYATKHGNMPLLGGLSYLAPLISTSILIANGQTSSNITVALSAVLTVGGSLLASLRRKKKDNAQ